MWSTFSTKKMPDFSGRRLGRGGVGVGVRVSVRVRISVYGGVLGLFRSIPSRNTGTKRELHQIPRFLHFILDNNEAVFCL